MALICCGDIEIALVGFAEIKQEAVLVDVKPVGTLIHAGGRYRIRAPRASRNHARVLFCLIT
jgi:hypothetical protein